MYKSSYKYIFSLYLSTYTVVGFLAHMVSACLTLQETSIMFSKEVAPFYPALYGISSWPRSAPTLGNANGWTFGYFSACEMVSHCGLLTERIEHLFLCVFAVHVPFMMSFPITYPFKLAGLIIPLEELFIKRWMQVICTLQIFSHRWHFCLFIFLRALE